MNFYSYCSGDPINYSDPTGHWKIITMNNQDGKPWVCVQIDPGDSYAALGLMLAGDPNKFAGWANAITNDPDYWTQESNPVYRKFKGSEKASQCWFMLCPVSSLPSSSIVLGGDGSNRVCNRSLLIHDQSDDYVRGEFGLGTIANNGCGAIAIYNALVLQGTYIPLRTIVSYIENNSGLWLEGLFGVDPSKMARLIFELNPVLIRRSRVDIFIFGYLWADVESFSPFRLPSVGAHYVACERVGTTNRFNFYNPDYYNITIDEFLQKEGAVPPFIYYYPVY